MELKLGTYNIVTPDTAEKRMSVIIWGMAGAGKTTLAATAPGKKLWLLFDPDGTQVLAGRDDVFVLDLSGEKNNVTEKFMSDNPLGLERFLLDNPDIETVVFDSMTSYSVLCTENAVSEVKSATMENPGLKGFGHRNARLLRAIISCLRLTKRLNRHIILIAHEDTPEKRDDGTVAFVTLALGSKMTNQIGLTISEIWHLSDTGKERRIAVRPCRNRQPMKSRMFEAGDPEFIWKSNSGGINEWFNQWRDGGSKKVPVPK